MELPMFLPREHVLVLVTALLTVVYFLTRRFFRRRAFSRRHGCKPIANSATKDPFLGLDILPETIRAFCQHKVLEESCNRFHRYGHTFAAKELLSRLIITEEPTNIKTILSLNFQDYSVGYRHGIFSPLLGTGIFDTDGEAWASSRALLRPNFTRDQVSDLTPFEDLIQDLFALLPRDGVTVVDLQDLFFSYTIHSATEFLFGQSVGSLKTQASKTTTTETESELDFAHAFDYAQRAIIMRGTLGPLSIFYRDRKADKCNRICRAFAQRFVDEALQAVESPKQDTKLNEQTEPQPRQKYIFSHQLAWREFDRTRILDEMMNILLAGRDTTASLLSNLFFMLAKHPNIWDKLRREVSAALDGRKPTYEELRSLKYVQYCINELTTPHKPPIALRLHPVVPRNERLALHDTVLPRGGGPEGFSPLHVPAGTIVGYNIYSLHRRTDIYGSDANQFRPERWDPQDKESRRQPRPWEYLPFNGGPRICLGQMYALTEVGYVVVRMAQEFGRLRSKDPRGWEESLSLTLCSRNGVRVCLSPSDEV